MHVLHPTCRCILHTSRLKRIINKAGPFFGFAEAQADYQQCLRLCGLPCAMLEM